MKEVKYKTNINCGNCVKAVKGFLAEVEGISNWQVDTENPDKILVVQGETFDIKAIQEAVQDAGFDIELLEKT